jgi:hypothetical protein
MAEIWPGFRCRLSDIRFGLFCHLPRPEQSILKIVSQTRPHGSPSHNDPNGKAPGLANQLFAHMVMKHFFEA